MITHLNYAIHNWAKYMKYILILLISILYLTPVSADASVDGFFRENLVREGFFKDKAGFAPEADTRTEKHAFFISREERNLHPELAPSNNIKIPRRSVRVSNRPVVLSNGNITNIWTTGIITRY